MPPIRHVSDAADDSGSAAFGSGQAGQSFKVTAVHTPLLMACFVPFGDLKYANRVRWGVGADIGNTL